MALRRPGGGSEAAVTRPRGRPGTLRRQRHQDPGSCQLPAPGLITLLAKTDPQAQPRRRGLHPPGRARPRAAVVNGTCPSSAARVESCETGLRRLPRPHTALLGGVEGRGFAQMVKGPGNRAAAGGLRRSAWLRPRWTTPSATPPDRVVRQTDLAAPIGGQLPGRHGHQAHRGPAGPHAARRYGTGERVDVGRHGEASPPRPPWVALNAGASLAYWLFHQFDVDALLPRRPLMIVGGEPMRSAPTSSPAS